MYAIVDIAGKQFKVEKDKSIYTPSLQGEEGASVEFDKVLLFEEDGKVNLGLPTVKGIKVTGKIVGHGKGDKIIVFKKKRRKGYKKKNGHRQGYTKVLIESIGTEGVKTKAADTAKKEKKEEKPVKAAEVNKDDLTKISGIGKVFEKDLNAQGISTYQQLSQLTAKDKQRLSEEIEGISEESLDDFVAQAKNLAAGKPATDDLTKISGIGEVFIKVLYKHGIHTFEHLANLTDEDKQRLAEEIDGISEESLDDFIAQAKKLAKDKK
jgi:large subunit ribosomal protein L21